MSYAVCQAQAGAQSPGPPVRGLLVMQASDASPSKLSEALGHICGVNSNLDDVWAAGTEVSKPATADTASWR
jgi:hypothetical protein